MGIALACAVVFLAVPLAATIAAYALGGDRGKSSLAPLGPAGTAVAFVQEWLATAALLAAAGGRLRRAAPRGARRGVVILIPELYCSSAAFWYLRRRLRAAGWECVPGLDRLWRTADADAFGALDARIAALPAAAELVVAGHGLGGRLALAYAAARPGLPIRHVVTLATPHRGSAALPYRVLGADRAAPFCPPGAELDVIALYSDFDAWLEPLDNAYCPGGFNIAVNGIGHCAALVSRRMADLVVENLSRAPRRDI